MSKSQVRKVDPLTVRRGRGEIILAGRWNNALVAEYVLERATKKFLRIEPIATFVYHRNDENNRRRVRKNMTNLFKTFLGRGHLLAVEYYGERGSASAVKLADMKNPAERQLVDAKLKRMFDSKEITRKDYEKAQRLADELANHPDAGADPAIGPIESPPVLT